LAAAAVVLLQQTLLVADLAAAVGIGQAGRLVLMDKDTQVVMVPTT
jgi:hypothetical protein